MKTLFTILLTIACTVGFAQIEVSGQWKGKITATQIQTIADTAKRQMRKEVRDTAMKYNRRLMDSVDRNRKQLIDSAARLRNELRNIEGRLLAGMTRQYGAFLDSLADLPVLVPKETLMAKDSTYKSFQLAFAPVVESAVVSATDDGERYYILDEGFYTLYGSGRLTTKKPYRWPLKISYIRQ